MGSRTGGLGGSVAEFVLWIEEPLSLSSERSNGGNRSLRGLYPEQHL
jgi:hypothetical protein